MSDYIDFIESFQGNKHTDIQEYMKHSIKEDNVELEVVYGDLSDKSKFLTKQQFLDLKNYLSQEPHYDNLGVSDTLDIKTELRKKYKSFPSSHRLSIEGIAQIQKYCKQDLLETVEFSLVNKLRYKDTKNPSINFDSLISKEYPCRVNLKRELPIDRYSKEGNVFTKDWSTKNKSFRYKKRYSFLSKNKIWRIDITAVKQTRSGEYFKTFKSSNVLGQREIFEFEIEYVGNSDEKKLFDTPPIVKYAELVNDVDVRDYEWTSSTGNVHNTVDDFTLDLETEELYLDQSSPRYDQGIEFDEPINSPTPISYMPSTITIKKEFWKDTENDVLWNEIYKGYTSSNEWELQSYKFIPRKKVTQGNNVYIETEISPHITLETGEVSMMTVPVEYIVENIEGVWYQLENPVAESPRSIETPESPKGGSMDPRAMDRSAKKGGGLFDLIDTTTYNKAVIDGLLGDLNNILIECFEVIQGTKFILSKSAEISIIKEYCNMTDQSYNPKWSFVGPQPVSMGVEHLNPLNPNSIVSGYAVTEKADGVRAELIIKDKQGYLITPKKKVIQLGVMFETNDNWIFDGEYITQNKQGQAIQLFMIFDLYYSSQSPSQPHTLPWYSKKGLSRSGSIHDFKETVTITSSTNSCRIGFKQYFNGPDKLIEKDGKYKNISTIMKYSKKILDKELNSGGFEYFTDGLIFLPMFLPVKGTSEGESVKSIKGTWSLNYKWKPPEENTIDFKIIFYKKNPDIYSYTYEGDDGRKEVRKYQKVQLAVGYKEQDDTSIDFNWAQLTNRPRNKQNFQYFDPPDHKTNNIHITNIPLNNGKMICEKDKKSIEPGMIVEMRYDPDSTTGYHWIPLRLRDDKIQPQYFKIANNIWNTINNPVTPEMIQGVVNFEELKQIEPKSQEYYVNTYETEDTPIRDLHNYIKSKLISRVGSAPHKGGLMIADLSCGRGGDIKKYLSIRNKIEFMMGLDISSNINEAAQRYHYLMGTKPKALFLQYDTSKSILEKEGCLGDTDICETMIDIIMNKSHSVSKEFKEVQRDYKGIAKQGFDIVSSQFSLHYYFKNEETLRGFCENLRDLCCSGGYFIGTCYDGMEVFRMFDQINKDTVEMKDQFGSLIYQIKKLYDTPVFDYEPGTLSKEGVMGDMLGKEIEVFMSSIGQPIIEYLVNFQFFIELMEEYGFVPAIPPFGKGEFNMIKQPLQSFNSIIANLDTIRDRDDEFIRKTKKTELYKVKPGSEYARLSGLNTTFIFQKK